MASPTQRTLERLKKQGIPAGIVERFIAQAGPFGVRKDLFGFIDVIAADPERALVIGVQCCSVSTQAAHIKKVTEDCRDMAINWLLCGAAIEVWGWRKLKVGVKAVRWEPRIIPVTLADLDP